MKRILCNLLRDRSGTTAIEYALIAGGIFLAVVSAVNTLGNSVLNGLFGQVTSAMTAP